MELKQKLQEELKKARLEGVECFESEINKLSIICKTLDKCKLERCLKDLIREKTRSDKMAETLYKICVEDIHKVQYDLEDYRNLKGHYKNQTYLEKKIEFVKKYL